jgi:hypothetical protein
LSGDFLNFVVSNQKLRNMDKEVESKAVAGIAVLLIYLVAKLLKLQ